MNLKKSLGYDDILDQIEDIEDKLNNSRIGKTEENMLVKNLEKYKKAL